MSREIFKRTVSVLLLLCVCLTLVSCNKDGEKGGTKGSIKGEDHSSKVLVLPYSREDGINPFTAKTLINQPLMSVIYAGLFTIGADYSPVPNLGKSYKVEGNTVIVNLDTSRKFHDGTTVKADDVVYSFNKAKESVYYGSGLTGIISASAANPTTVVFDTGMANKFAAACFDFPVVKINTAEANTAVPVGAGFYKYAKHVDGGRLTKNTFYPIDEYKMETVDLVNITDSESLMHGLVIGNFDALFDDLATGKSQRMNASTVQVPLNNMIFLGVNQRGPLADPKFREYLSVVINRGDLISSGPEGYGVASAFPFNPSFYGLDKATERKVNYDLAKEYLAKNTKGAKLSILVNSDNNFKVKLAEALCTQLNLLGIKTSLESVPYGVYTSGVASGSYDLYIGEYKLSNDMHIAFLLGDEELINQYYLFLAGSTTASEFLTAFFDKQPFIPIGFRNGVLVYSRSVGSEVKPLPENPYANLMEWFR